MIQSYISHFIIFLAVSLCGLTLTDLFQLFKLRDQSYWYQVYKYAVKDSLDLWKYGYRLEELESRLIYENVFTNKVFASLGSSTNLLRWSKITSHSSNENKVIEYRNLINQIQSIQYNKSSIVKLKCDQEELYWRIGLNDYSYDPKDSCLIYPHRPSNTHIHPNTYFEVIPYTNQTIALKSIINGYFIRMVPPGNNDVKYPWKALLSSPLLGYAERFRIDNMGIYSSMSGGYLRCKNKEGIFGYADDTEGSKIVLEHVSTTEVQQALEYISISNQIQAITTHTTLPSITTSSIQITTSSNGKNLHVDSSISNEHHPIKIALVIPITSKGTRMSAVEDSPFWTNLMDSFMKSIDWRTNIYYYSFYLGFDKGDEFYDIGDAWSEFRDEFHRRAIFRMSEMFIDQDEVELIVKKRIGLKLMHFDHLQGAPSQIVSQLVLKAYDDGYDYFYQVNDDTSIESSNWPYRLITCLQSNPLVPNLGVTGPSDSYNEKIFTHSFTHRTHVEIFGYLFPSVFKNWWSDDWISTVYGIQHTFKCPNVEIVHNVDSQKEGDIQRYNVDPSIENNLDRELLKGYVKINKWLKVNKHSRMSLPTVCGYSPLVKYIWHHLKSNTTTHSP